MNRIVIATDGSPEAEVAVEEGIALAEEVGAKLTFVYVRSALPLLGEPYYQRELSDQLRHGRTALDAALERAAERGVEAEAEILEGNVADAISTLAQRRAADLIVAGSRGHGALTSVLLGSVSRGLVERSAVPVMIVRDRAAVHARAHRDQ